MFRGIISFPSFGCIEKPPVLSNTFERIDTHISNKHKDICTLTKDTHAHTHTRILISNSALRGSHFVSGGVRVPMATV